jgi:ABC-2 type transport system permease protein
MNSTKLALTANVTPRTRPAFYWTLADMFVLAKRQLMRIPRSHQELGTATLQPVLVLLLFRYVFGGAIAVPPGTSYVNYTGPKELALRHDW